MTQQGKYINHLESCFAKAYNLDSKINDDIKQMEGMTGLMTRHLYNNLLTLDNATYIEVGVWKGSSCCSAMFGNKADVTLIDDFSGFGSPKAEFLSNLEKYKGENIVEFIEADCFKLKMLNNKKFNIYLYDGDHSEESQYNGIRYYLSVMEDLFIFIVDDWNWQSVRNGTYKAIYELNLEVIYKKEIRTSDNDEFPQQEIADNGFWNGIAVFIFKKQ